jgi:hypothetical protein
MRFKVLARVGKWGPGQIISLKADFPNLSQLIAQGFLEKIEENLPPPSSSAGGSEEKNVGASNKKRGRKSKRRVKK